MPHTRVPSQRAPHTLIPLIVVLGPLLCALTLTALGYVMFRAQASAGATSQSATATLSSPLEYTVILALAGALVSLLMAMLGLALYSRARRGAEAREKALAEGLDRLAALDRIIQRIAERGEWREAAATAWARRQRDALAQLSAMVGPRAALQRIAGDIWAGLSHPGAPLDASTALRMARESAVASAALGAALDDLRSLMVSSPAEVDAIEAIDDALVEDLIALEELARRTRRALAVAIGESGALPGSDASRQEDEAPVPFSAPAASEGRPAIAPAETATDASRRARRAENPISPNPLINGERPLTKDTGATWPPPVNGWPVGSEGPSAPNMRPAGSSGQWPRYPGDASGPGREPRDRDDNSSRWLND